MAQIREKTLVKGSVLSVYDFLSDTAHLQDLLSGVIDVELVDQPSNTVQKGSEHHWIMTRYGLSQEVALKIIEAKPGHRLSYQQSQGLFLQFRHEMEFEAHDADYCLITDLVDYQLPFGVVGHVLDDLWVKRDLRRILRNRSGVLKQEFKLRSQSGALVEEDFWP